MQIRIIFFSSFIFFLSTLSSRAQQEYHSEIGIQFGPGYADMRGNEYVEELQDATLGYAAGITFRHDWDRLFLKTGVTFERKGSELESNFTDNQGNLLYQGTIVSQVDYLNVPVLFGANLDKKKHVYVNAGPYFGYLLSVIYKYPKGYPIDDYNDTGSFQHLDLGISGGAGIRFPIGQKLNCSFELRHNRGLLNMAYGPVYGDGTIKNAITLGLFGLGYVF